MKHSQFDAMTSVLDAATTVLGAALLTLGAAEFMVISAIPVLMLLHGCVTELLILEIWVFFPDLVLAKI